MRPPQSVAVLIPLLIAGACSSDSDVALSSDPGGAPAATPVSEGVAVADAERRDIVLPGARVFPEGVAIDPATGEVYVGSTDDGTVFRAGLNDSEAEVFLPGGEDDRTAVTGLAVDGDRLFVAGRDTGRIFAYDTTSGELIAGYDTSDGERTLINDVVVAGDAAYVTDSFRPVLLRLDLTDGIGEPEPWLDLDDTDIVYG
ncbi:MAG: hypothetical protein M3337_04055, partial [Actinomycetota bacterium]|nr:hypothetical protein [Actinomycetota bacterium]